MMKGKWLVFPVTLANSLLISKHVRKTIEDNPSLIQLSSWLQTHETAWTKQTNKQTKKKNRKAYYWENEFILLIH